MEVEQLEDTVEPHIDEKLGFIVKMKRSRENISMTQLAKKIGISRETIGKSKDAKKQFIEQLKIIVEELDLNVNGS